MIDDDNKTLWCGNLPEQVTEELLYELFLQAGPLEKVRIPRDKDGRQKNFAFVTYCHEVSVPYAMSLFRGTALFHKTLSLQRRGRMALLPPPIRCYGPEPGLEFPSQYNVAHQFAAMTENIRDEDRAAIHRARGNDMNDKLTILSLQGNWSHRHHPYMSDKQKHGRDDYRPRDMHGEGFHNSGHSRHGGNWRDRRNRRKGGNHRRD